MNDEKRFKYDFTLEKLSSIASAINFWNLPNVQSKVQNYFEHNKPTTRFNTKWREIVDYVIEQVNQAVVSEILLFEIKIYIPLIGEKIYNWTVNVTTKVGFNLHLKYAQNIYWTPHGTIDEQKIVKEFWLKESEFVVHRSSSFLNNPLFTLAVEYAQEDFIRDNMDKMKKQLNLLLPIRQRLKKWTVYGLLSTWWIFDSHKNKVSALNYLKGLKQKPNNLPAKQLFERSLWKSSRFTVEYFWNKLSSSEKLSCIGEAANNFIAVCGYPDTNRYWQDVENGIIIFLMNEMSVIQSAEFTSENIVTLFECFLNVWPYQEFCMTLLDKDWHYKPADINKLLKLIMKYLTDNKKNKKIHYGIKNVYRAIFQKLLERTSIKKKKKYFVSKSLHSFYDNYKNFDVPSLSLILIDKDLKEYRDQILVKCEGILKNLVLQENYKELNQFINNAFSKEEKKIFKRKLNFLISFLISGEFRKADKHLNWLYDVESERLAAKKETNALDICLNLIKKFRFDLASEFLIWRFESEEERKNFKIALNKSDEFLRDEIYKIWCSRNQNYPVVMVENKCLEMLKWFLHSDEVIDNFKKFKLVENEFFIVKYWNNLFYEVSFVDLDYFLKFCQRTPEDIEEFKKNIRNNIFWWIDNFAVKETMMIKALLDWVFEDVQLKQDIISNYMNSPKGALLCINVFKKYAVSRRTIITFFNSWIEEFSNINISEMKMNLKSFDDSVVMNGLKPFILTLLTKRKDGEIIRLSDLPKTINGFNECTAFDSDKSYTSDEEYYDSDYSSVTSNSDST